MKDVSRQAFEEENSRIASQKKAAQATSTNQLSTDRLFVSTDRSFVSTDRSNTPNVSAASTSTEDTSDTLPNDGIFNGAYDDDADWVQMLILTTWITPLLLVLFPHSEFIRIIQKDKF
ncbi:hypothetical protein Tco_0136121, partial [Tanacetum coccineum]